MRTWSRGKKAPAGDLVARQQRPQHGQRLVHPASPGGRVDAAGAQLGRVLAAQADAEDQPLRRELGERGDLPGDRDGMAQGQQVHGGLPTSRRDATASAVAVISPSKPGRPEKVT